MNIENFGDSDPPNLHPTSAHEWLSIDTTYSWNSKYVEKSIFSQPRLEGIELTTNRLSASVALVLRKANTEFLFLTVRQPLGIKAAGILGGWPFSTRPIRDITIEDEISVASARALIGETPGENECDRPLSITVPTLTPGVASVLARHTNELFVTISRSIVDEDVVCALNDFYGRGLFLDPLMGLTDEARKKLVSNPKSRVKIWSYANGLIQ